ncbi:precorrin-3B synthase [uncultured Bartonella sp.]|uniref:precorrin-3B synthase n=1 Tax=uncultured Bartonella sp. TaxID=104108 RepID=UPI00263122FF|nr:precorrin-3B synthase [uncultured Bartonella sp.]
MISFPISNGEREIKNTKDRRFACPGLFRMPAANDGGICRIKLPMGQFNDKAIEGVADAAEIFSNSHVELTTRANLQIRAVAKHNEKQLIAALLELGLGPLTREGDDIRNVMVAPTAGIDCNMFFDTTQLGKKLLEMLQTNRQFSRLSPKFSFLINGGETTKVTDHVADIWLSALPDGEKLNFGFASCSDNDCNGKSTAVGSISTDKALEFIRSCLETFIAVSKSDPSISRMKHLCHSQHYSVFLTDLRQRFPHKIAKPVTLPQKPTKVSALTGIFPQNDRPFFYVGARPHLGRLSSLSLRAIAKIIKIRAQNSPIRLTHYQGIIVPDCSAYEAELIKKELASIGLAVDKSDPALDIFCCAGAPACRSGLSNVQRDGKYLIDYFTSALTNPVHLTACPKACVATVAFDFTALATKDSVYDLYRADCSNTHKFGKLLFQNMTISDIAHYIEEISKRSECKKV